MLYIKKSQNTQQWSRETNVAMYDSFILSSLYVINEKSTVNVDGQ